MTTADPVKTAITSDSEYPSSGERRRKLWAMVTLSVLVVLTFVACITACITADAMFPGRYAGPVAVSPDGRYEAQVYGTNCGVLCDFHAWVDVRDRRASWMPWPLPIDVDRLSIDYSDTVYDAEQDACHVGLQWADDNTLVVMAGPHNQQNPTTLGNWRDVRFALGPVAPDEWGDDSCLELGSRRFQRERREVVIPFGLLFGFTTTMSFVTFRLIIRHTA